MLCVFQCQSISVFLAVDQLQRVAEEVDDRDWRTRAPLPPAEAGRESREGVREREPGEARQPRQQQPQQQQAEQQQQPRPQSSQVRT
jgi:translation initiation factor 4G